MTHKNYQGQLGSRFSGENLIKKAKINLNICLHPEKKKKKKCTITWNCYVLNSWVQSNIKMVISDIII